MIKWEHWIPKRLLTECGRKKLSESAILLEITERKIGGGGGGGKREEKFTARHQRHNRHERPETRRKTPQTDRHRAMLQQIIWIHGKVCSTTFPQRALLVRQTLRWQATWRPPHCTLQPRKKARARISQKRETLPLTAELIYFSLLFCGPHFKRERSQRDFRSGTAPEDVVPG